MSDKCSVQVALRIRPLIESEISKGCQDVLEVYPELEQVRIKNSDRAFTFNHILSSKSTQHELYTRCVQDLISDLFKGYNVTILAYGQTGSGKTYSMGTAYTGHGEMGVIPRAIYDIFENVRNDSTYDFKITVSFMELYQEVLFDLLSQKPRDQCSLDIREDPSKGIVIQGLSEIPAHSIDDVLYLLAKGSERRSTGSTNMNALSSRSHAIFTINITMQNKTLSERKMARFNLVDLAGSERSKKTGAIGTTFREGVTINKGLLVLGNVISALGDDKQQTGFVPYRDSNLTRLLKDSLGGNSVTLMIACVSPADYNVDETMSTLRYADRAKKIKNKPIVNKDARAAEIIELRQTIQQLRLQIIAQGGPILCPAEIQQLTKENGELLSKNRNLTFQLSNVLSTNTSLEEKILLLQTANDTLSNNITELRDDYNSALDKIRMCVETDDKQLLRDTLDKMQAIQKHISAIDTDQRERSREISKHNNTFTVLLNASHHNEVPTEPEINECQATFTKRQMDLKSELEEITLKLAMKEHLALQIQNNSQYMIDYSAVTENEDKIKTLTQEKEELLKKLRDIQTKDSASKCREQRWKNRIQELEKHIDELKKKAQEWSRLTKLREKDEMKMKHLNTEILQIKQEKVRLIRNMKEEGERFRSWRLQRERELAKLKKEDRKKQHQIVKMEAMHTKQQTILKRKVEKVAAVNKRLKEALESRTKLQLEKPSGKMEKTIQWLKLEMEVYSSIIEAANILPDLLEDRATLQQQLNELKANLDDADPDVIRSLQDDIEYRSIQIQDLQQKILDYNEESKAKTRWDAIHSMIEAKAALKTLWELCAEFKTNEVIAARKISELQLNLSEATDKINNIEVESKILKQKHIQETDLLHKEQEEKIEILLKILKQFGGKQVEAADDQLRESLTKLIEKLEDQTRVIKKVEKDNVALNEKLSTAQEQLDSYSKQIKELQELSGSKTGVSEEDSQNMVTPPPRKLPNIRIVKVKKPNVSHEGLFQPPQEENDELYYSTDYEVEDNDGTPDWKKTPLGKRILKEKEKINQTTLYMETLGIKRCSEGGCACAGDCTERCSCKRASRGCGGICKCDKFCANRNNLENTSSVDSSSMSEGESYSKRQRFFHLDLPVRQLPKRTEPIFKL